MINDSPKGLDSFRTLDPTTVAYADMTGSGIETAGHLKENGRIVLPAHRATIWRPQRITEPLIPGEILGLICTTYIHRAIGETNIKFERKYLFEAEHVG